MIHDDTKNFLRTVMIFFSLQIIALILTVIFLHFFLNIPAQP